MKLQDRVAFITGSSSGIGRATALLLAREGAKIGVLGLEEDRVHDTVAMIADEGGEALPLVADVSQPAQVEAAIEQIVAAWGRIDIVFANAGINGVWASIEVMTPEDWDTTLAVNLRGAFLAVKYAVPYLKVGGGSVIVTGSVNGTRVFSNSGATAYAAAKAGQVALAKMLAVELARYKIRVNAICPGWIDTNIRESTFPKDVDKIRHPVIWPEGRIPLTGKHPGKPEQVAQAVLFLASDESSHITGTELWIDGGESLIQG